LLSECPVLSPSGGEIIEIEHGKGVMRAFDAR
jgi:hypothetical protein